MNIPFLSSDLLVRYMSMLYDAAVSKSRKLTRLLSFKWFVKKCSAVELLFSFIILADCISQRRVRRTNRQIKRANVYSRPKLWSVLIKSNSRRSGSNQVRFADALLTNSHEIYRIRFFSGFYFTSWFENTVSLETQSNYRAKSGKFWSKDDTKLV